MSAVGMSFFTRCQVMMLTIRENYRIVERLSAWRPKAHICVFTYVESNEGIIQRCEKPWQLHSEWDASLCHKLTTSTRYSRSSWTATGISTQTTRGSHRGRCSSEWMRSKGSWPLMRWSERDASSYLIMLVTPMESLISYPYPLIMHKQFSISVAAHYYRNCHLWVLYCYNWV